MVRETEKETLGECRFISMMGRGAFGSKSDVKNRLGILEKYRDALLARTDWNGISREVVIRHIDMEIAREALK